MRRRSFILLVDQAGIRPETPGQACLLKQAQRTCRFASCSSVWYPPQAWVWRLSFPRYLWHAAAFCWRASPPRSLEGHEKLPLLPLRRLLQSVRILCSGTHSIVLGKKARAELGPDRCNSSRWLETGKQAIKKDVAQNGLKAGSVEAGARSSIHPSIPPRSEDGTSLTKKQRRSSDLGRATNCEDTCEGSQEVAGLAERSSLLFELFGYSHRWSSRWFRLSRTETKRRRWSDMHVCMYVSAAPTLKHVQDVLNAVSSTCNAWFTLQTDLLVHSDQIIAFV